MYWGISIMGEIELPPNVTIFFQYTTIQVLFHPYFRSR